MLGGKIKQFKKPILALLIAMLVVVNSLVFMATSTAVEKEAVDVSKIQNTISFDVEKYVNYEIENEKGALIQLTGKTGLTFDAGQKEIPLERIGVRFVVPKIKDSYPESVEVLDGFVKSYDKQSGVVILGATKDFSMLLNYGENAYVKEPVATELVLKGDLASKLQNDSNKSLNQIVMGKFEQKIKLEEKAGLISSEIETTPLYNGFINRNIDTDYQEKYSVAISKKELGDKITLEINNQFGKNEVKNVSTTFNKSNVLSVLGEKGSLKILDGEKVLQEINKDTKADEKDLITYNYDEKVSNIKIEISKPEKVGTIKFINAKQISADIVDKTANTINVQNKFTVTKNNENIYEYTENKELNVNEAKPQVIVETTNNTWTNNDINNVEFIVKMSINNNTCSLFNNPVINIKLPEEVAKAIVDEDVLGKTTISNPNGLTINSIQYNENDKTIQIALSGDQKELVKANDTKETEIKIPVLVKMVNPLTNASTKINVECKNTNIFTNSEEIGTSSLEIKLEDMNKQVAKENVVTEEVKTEENAEITTITEEAKEEKLNKNMILTSEPNIALRNFFKNDLRVNDTIKANDKITFILPSFMQYDTVIIMNNNIGNDKGEEFLDSRYIDEQVVRYSYNGEDYFEVKLSEDKTKVEFTALKDCENYNFNIGTQTKNDRLLEIAKTISGNTIDAKIEVIYETENNTSKVENTYKVGINKVSVVMESPTEGEFVQKGDTVSYKIKVKNEGKVTYDPDGLYYVSTILYVKTPEEIGDLKATYNNWKIQNNEDGTKQLIAKTNEEEFAPLAYEDDGDEIPNVKIQLVLPYNETSEVELTGKVNSSIENKNIKARALVSNNLGTLNYNYLDNNYEIAYKENVNSVYSNIVTHRLQKEVVENTRENKVNTPTVINNEIKNETTDNNDKIQKNDFKVENYITKITTKTEDEIIEHEVNNKESSKVTLNSNELTGDLEQVEYKIVVTNNGETAGTLEKIVDYIPQGLSLDKLSNANWTENTDGTVENRSLSTKVLQPGESKEVKLVLTKNNQEESNTSFNNKVMIQGTNTVYNNEEVDLLNNTANAELTITTNNIVLYIIIAMLVVIAILIVLNIKFKFFKFTKIRMLSIIALSVIIAGGYSSIAYTPSAANVTYNNGIVTIKRRLWITSREEDRWRWSTPITIRLYYIKDDGTLVLGRWITDEYGTNLKIKPTDYIEVTKNGYVRVFDSKESYDDGDDPITSVRFSDSTSECDTFARKVYSLYDVDITGTQWVKFQVNDGTPLHPGAGDYLTYRGQALKFMYGLSDWKVVVDPDLTGTGKYNGMYKSVGSCGHNGTLVSLDWADFDNKVTAYRDLYEAGWRGKGVNVYKTAGPNYMFQYNVNTGKPYFGDNDVNNVTPTVTTSGITSFTVSSDSSNVSTFIAGNETVVGPIRLKASSAGTITSVDINLNNGTTKTGTIADSHGNTYTSHTNVGTSYETNGNYFVKIANSELGSNRITGIKFNVKANEVKTTNVKYPATTIVWRDINNPTGYQPFNVPETLEFSYPTTFAAPVSVTVNQVLTTDLKIVKKDTNGNNLQGVKFKVQRIDEVNNTSDWVNTDANYNFTSGTTESNAKVLETNANGETPVIKGLPVNYVYKLYEIDLGGNHQLVEINGKRLITPEYATVTETDTSNMSHSGMNNYNGSNGRITFRNVSGNTVTVTVSNEFKPVTLSGYVWRDIKKGKNQQLRNDVKDSEENTIADITVELLENGVVKATTTVNNDGFYKFENIPGKDINKYSVRFNYDGLKYSPVSIDTSTGSSKVNTSKATENSAKRTELNAKGENIESYDEIKVNNGITAEISKEKVKSYYDALVPSASGNTISIENLNLGLYNREMPDVALTKTVTKSDMQFLNEDVASDNMNVAFTYAITLINNSSNLTTKINAINDYFSDNLELADNKIYDQDGNEIPAIRIQKTEELSNEEINGYNNYRIDFPNGIIIEPHKTKKLFVKFNLPVESIQEFINKVLLHTTDIKNYAEIANYSIYSDNQTTKPYLGYDLDSEPNNFKDGKNEDDNDNASGMRTVELLIRNILNIISNNSRNTTVNSAANNTRSLRTTNSLQNTTRSVDTPDSTDAESGEESNDNNGTEENSNEDDGEGESDQNSDDENDAEEQEPAEKIVLNSSKNPYIRNNFIYTINVNEKLNTGDKINISVSDYMKLCVYNIDSYSRMGSLSTYYPEENNTNRMVFKELNEDEEEEDVIESVINDEKSVITFTALKDINIGPIRLGTETNNSNVLEYAKTAEGNSVDAPVTVSLKDIDNNEIYSCIKNTNIGFNKVSINMSSPTQGEKIKKGDTVTYNIKVKNEGKISYSPDGLYYVQVVLQASTPEELDEINVTYDNWEIAQNTNDELEEVNTLVKKEGLIKAFSSKSYDYNDEETYNVKIPLIIPYNEEIELTITGKVKYAEINKEIKARAMLSNKIFDDVSIDNELVGNTEDFGFSYREFVNDVYSDIVTHNLLQDNYNNESEENQESGNTEHNDDTYDSDKKLDFKVENYITKVTTETSNGTTEKVFDNSSLAKIEIHSKEIVGAQVKVEYKIVVTNNGELPGTVGKIVGYIPEGMSLDKDSNSNWTINTDGTIENRFLSTKLIQPGKSEEIKLVLNKTLSEDSIGSFNNKVVIDEISSMYNVNDINSQNNIANSEIIISVGTGITTYVIIAIIIIIVIALLIVLNIKFNIFKSFKFKLLSIIVLAVVVISGISALIVYADSYIISSGNVTYTTNGNEITIERNLMITGRITDRHRYHYADSQKVMCTPYYLTKDSNGKDTVVAGTKKDIDGIVKTLKFKVNMSDSFAVSKSGDIYINPVINSRNEIRSYDAKYSFSGQPLKNEEFGKYVKQAWRNEYRDLSDSEFEKIPYITFSLNSKVSGQSVAINQRTVSFLYLEHDWQVVADPNITTVMGYYKDIGDCIDPGQPVTGNPKLDLKAAPISDVLYEYYKPEELSIFKLPFTCNEASPYVFKHSINESLDSDNDFYYLTNSNRPIEEITYANSNPYNLYISNTNAVNCTQQGDYIVMGSIGVYANRTGGTLNTEVQITLSNNTTVSGELSWSTGGQYTGSKAVETTVKGFYVRVLKSKIGNNTIKSVKFTAATNEKNTKTIKLNGAQVIWKDKYYENRQRFRTKENWTLKYSWGNVSSSASIPVNHSTVNKANLKIKKVDANGNIVKGVKFKVQRIDEKNNTSDWINTDSNYNFTSGTTENNAKVLETNASGETPVIKGLPVNYVYKIYEIDLGENHQLVELNGKKLILPGDATVTETDTSNMSHSGINNYNGSNGRITFRNVSGNTVTVTVKNNVKPVSLSGYVWEDGKQGKNEQVINNIKDSNDKVLSGISVELLLNGNPQQPPVTAITDSTGKYTFNNLDAKNIGKFSVRFNYDGLNYAPVAVDTATNVSPKENTSKGTEDSTRRNTLNNKSVNITSHANIKTGNDITAQITAANIQAYYNAISKTSTDSTINISNLNLGLLQREMPDLALVKDIYGADVEFNGAKYTYYFGQGLDKKAENSIEGNIKTITSLGIQVENEVDNNHKYSLPIYESDVEYLKETNDPGKLKVNLTYAIGLVNNSFNLIAGVKEINEYYSDNISLTSDKNVYLDAQCTRIIGQIEEVQNFYDNNTKKAKIVLNNDILISPNSSMNLYIKYSLPDATFYDFEQHKLYSNISIRNMSEISKYSVMSGIVNNNNKMYYLGYDYDSEPNNFENGKLEDDNDIAYGIQIVDAGERIVKGTVFEDKKIKTETDENGNKISIGNSIFDDGENVIKNAKVNIINIDNPSEKVKVYDNIQKKFVDYEEVATDENGNYEIKGLIPGNYQLQFIWGNGTVSLGENGTDYVTISDYNSTPWSEENTELHNQENWYLPKINQIRYSDAKEDLTPMFTLGIEVDDYSVGTGVNKVPSIGIYQFILDKLDFGLIKKPEKIIKLTKRIQHIRISAEGMLLVDSDIDYTNGKASFKNTDNLKYTKYIPASIIEPFGIVQSEVDNTIFPLDIEITYEIIASYENVDTSELNNIKIFDYLDDVLENKNVDNVNITTKSLSDYNAIIKNLTKIEQAYRDNQDVNSEKINKIFNEWQNVLSPRAAKLSNKKIYELNELEELLKGVDEREQVSTTFKVVGKIANNADDISLVNDVEAIVVDPELDIETPYISYMDRAQKVVITPQTGENKNYVDIIIITITSISAIVILVVGIILIKKKVL